MIAVLESWDLPEGSGAIYVAGAVVGFVLGTLQHLVHILVVALAVTGGVLQEAVGTGF